MSLQSASNEKPLKNFVASFVETHPDASMHNIAVLFTDVVGSTKYFKAHGDIKGREMLRKHHRIAIAIVEDYGGSLIKEVGDSVMVYFPDALNALKASIKMQHQFNSYNKNNESQNEIHIRVGIHFGKVIVEEKDIYGDVVNVAAKLTNLANGDQVFISREVYELTKNMSSAKFELVNFWNMKNVPTGLTIYKVIWENSPISEPDRVAVLYLRLKKYHDPDMTQNHFRDIWDNFIRRKNTFLANKHESECTLPNGTLIMSYKDSSTALEIAALILAYLSDELKKTGSAEKPPLHMVITKDTHTRGNLLPIKKSKMDLEGFNPGDIYLSKNVYDDIKKQRDMSATPPPNEHHGKAFYKYVMGQSEQRSPEQLCNNKSNPAKETLEPCFYCGGKNHYTKNCPSKILTETTPALNEAGYFSPDKIRMLLSLYQGTQDTPQNITAVLRANAYGEQELITNCFYELKSIYQLRFFRTIWESNLDLWEKAKKNISVSEGGFAWLALDSFRVSNYGRAETFLKTAADNNVNDYKPHCIKGFINIERNNFTDALKDFDNALLLSRRNPQKMFLYFLQSRIYTLIGNIQKAQEKINKILTMDPGCTEAVYEDIILKLKQDKEKTAIQRLIKLIDEVRKYYVVALVDPDMKTYSKAVNEALTKIFNEAKADALHCYDEARMKVNSIRDTLTKKNNEDIQFSMAKIENLISSESYFGYLDIAKLGNSVILICSNALKEQKKNLSDTILRLNKRLEQDLTFVRRYRYPQFSTTCLKKLKSLKASMTDMSNTNEYISADQFEACHDTCGKIAQELDSQELIIRKLEILQQSVIVSLSFLKHSSIFFSIVFFLGIFLFPLLTEPINSILAKLDISSISDDWSFQKTFLVSGGIVSLVVSFLITAKKSL
jgi:class 3 adenylate cyclase/tetratricopeptide (TPR) repeat protein